MNLLIQKWKRERLQDLEFTSATASANIFHLVFTNVDCEMISQWAVSAYFRTQTKAYLAKLDRSKNHDQMIVSRTTLRLHFYPFIQKSSSRDTSATFDKRNQERHAAPIKIRLKQNRAKNRGASRSSSSHEHLAALRGAKKSHPKTFHRDLRHFTYPTNPSGANKIDLRAFARRFKTSLPN